MIFIFISEICSLTQNQHTIYSKDQEEKEGNTNGKKSIDF